MNYLKHNFGCLYKRGIKKNIFLSMYFDLCYEISVLKIYINVYPVKWINKKRHCLPEYESFKRW